MFLEMLMLLLAPETPVGPVLFLISAAMVMKACSTFVAFLADVSRKGMLKLSANSWKGEERADGGLG